MTRATRQREIGFEGFAKQTVSFFSQLAKNNDKGWFDLHRDDYEQHVLAPAQAFVGVMGQQLGKISKGIVADPRVNKSLFRLNRDVRFSKDKRPYKTHLGIYFWEEVGGRKRMECPGFYFHLEPGRLMLGVGMYIFPKDVLEAYRQAVVDPKQGPALVRAVKQVEGKGYSVAGEHYKRVPRGYDPEHKHADLLRHNGLAAMTEGKLPAELYSAKIVERCFSRFKEMAPLHRWLKGLLQRM